MPKVKNQERANEAKGWIEQVLGVKLNNFFEDIKDGTVLCELCNKILPGSCKKFKKSNVPFVCRTNIQIYIKGCEKIGVPETDRFETRDLFDQQRLDQVVDNIFSLSAASRKVQSFKGPYIGVKYNDKNVRNFSQEVLNKSKSSVPLWNQGDKEHKTSNLDSYGIVKKQGLEKHTGVQSTWEKGSKQNDLSDKHDSYGVVLVKGVDKHTGVQSTWEKGSKQNDLSSNHDSYGVVLVKGVDKHTGVQSTWEKGSKQNDLSSNHDSYGVVLVKGTDKHTGVQNTWEKGSKQTNQDNGLDSSGVKLYKN